MGVFAYLLMRVAEPDYALLYAGLELEGSAGSLGERITLVDDCGNLLARGGDLDPDSLIASDGEDYRAAYEARMKRTVAELLARSLGPDRVRAQVHSEMDFDRVITTEEEYDPEGRVVRSTQTIEEETGLHVISG